MNRRSVAPILLGSSLLGALACGGSTSSSSTTGGSSDASAEATIAHEGGAEAGGEAGADAGADGAEAAVDAGADVDNGAPSTTYPAPHPPLPVLTNANHGPVLTAPKVVLVFFPGYPYEAQLQAFAQSFATSTYWSTTTSEYGVGAITYGGTIDLPSGPPASPVTAASIQSWVASQIQSGAFGTPDSQALYTIVYPQSTTITQPNPVSPVLGDIQSCVAFGGYHDDTQVQGDAGTQGYPYAVIPTCGTVLDDLTAVLSHEWVEAATDPLVTASGPFTLSGGPQSAFYTVDPAHAVWAVLGGGEAGDLCEPEAPAVYVTPSDLGHLVQRTWSNASAQASHDPCVPALAGQAFFDSAPVLNETVTFTSSLTGSITTQGVTIPVGQSKTIEVDLFSDGDTGGPWTVTADDVLAKYYGSYGITSSLDFAWDRTTGVNGEKLHLTITVKSASIIGNGHAFMITSTKGTRDTVWPGMIVE